MKSSIACVLVMLCTAEAYAGIMAGIIVDSSSNILLCPESPAGTVTSAYSDLSLTRERMNISYWADGGMLESREGIQFHHHDLCLSYGMVSHDTFEMNVGLKGEIGRYGDVTVLTGYNQYGIESKIRSYVTDSTLLRWQGEIIERSYSVFDTESYSEADTVIRLDRFFGSGTTLRGQIEAGLRRYNEQPLSPTTLRYGYRARIARSLGPVWGMFVEFHSSRLRSYRSLGASPVFERYFIDDRYKFSSYGLEVGTKCIFPESGGIQLTAAAGERNYGNNQTSYSLEVPVDGWREWEKGVRLTISRRPGFFPEHVHPSCEVYYIHVDASSADMRYTTAGLNVRFDLY